VHYMSYAYLMEKFHTFGYFCSKSLAYTRPLLYSMMVHTLYKQLQREYIEAVSLIGFIKNELAYKIDIYRQADGYLYNQYDCKYIYTLHIISLKDKLSIYLALYTSSVT